MARKRYSVDTEMPKRAQSCSTVYRWEKYSASTHRMKKRPYTAYGMMTSGSMAWVCPQLVQRSRKTQSSPQTVFPCTKSVEAILDKEEYRLYRVLIKKQGVQGAGEKIQYHMR